MRAAVLSFWFEEIEPSRWWCADCALDDTVRCRFGGVTQRAAAGELYPWRTTPAGRLAEIIVLDQFSRCSYRGTPRAFAQDAIALVLAQEAVASGVLTTLTPPQCSCLLMPYLRSESRLIHVAAEALFRDFTPSEHHAHAVRHKAIIDRFGRDPHRNGVLERSSTPDEDAFLTQAELVT